MVSRSPDNSDRGAPRRLLARQFAVHATVALAAVIALGAVLAITYRSAAERRGVAEGRSEAILLARTAVEPILGGRPLGATLSSRDQARLRQLTDHVVSDGDVLRLRIRNLAGQVVFSDDGSGFGGRPDGEVLSAARGAVIAKLTHLNADTNDSGGIGPATVEVYTPLEAGSPRRPVGILEVYLPYAPISADVTSDLHTLYLDLAIGLVLLYLVLLLITSTVSRGLRRQVAENAHLAEFDSLTDLPNRALFQRRADEALERGDSIAVAIIDVDRFREVNDTLGHSNGDHLIVELGRRLAEEAGPGDTVARIGGDEFGVVLSGRRDPEHALWQMRHLMEQEIVIGGVPISVESSIGLAASPDDGTTAADLLQHADIAMYAAKTSHEGVVRYEPALDRYELTNLGLLTELRNAIPAGELVLHFQPKTSLPGGHVNSVEALVRWQHPSKGLLTPAAFLPLAERTDVIFDLTRWVLGEALRYLAELPADISVAVNVSARSLASASFAQSVIDAIENAGAAAERLILEVTETALLTDPARAAEILGALDARGVRVSLDDFGSGQTSLGYLSTLPLRELKIDMSFIRDMLDNPAHAAIVTSIIELGHNLSLRVVGEGVESGSVLAQLTSIGCDEAQGYFLARPMPADQLDQWLAARQDNPELQPDLL